MRGQNTTDRLSPTVFFVYGIPAGLWQVFVQMVRKKMTGVVRSGDCSRSEGSGWKDCKNVRKRSELIQRGKTQREGGEYWYHWSIYIPASHQNLYGTKVAHCQFHQEDCEPVFMFNENEGGCWLQISGVAEFSAIVSSALV